MTDPDFMVLYPDEEGVPPDGKIFYPASLRRITPALTELNAELINDIVVYSALLPRLSDTTKWQSLYR